MIDMDVLAQIAEILEENYYTLLSTGDEVIETAKSDLESGYWNNDPDNTYTDDEISAAIEYLRVKFHIEGKLKTSAGYYYTHIGEKSFEIIKKTQREDRGSGRIVGSSTVRPKGQLTRLQFFKKNQEN